MVPTNQVASSRPTNRKVFERAATCHAPSDIGVKLNRGVQKNGLAKLTRTRRRSISDELTSAINPASWAGAARRDLHAELTCEVDGGSEFLSHTRNAAEAVGDIPVLLVSLGMIVAAAVTLAAGLCS